MTTPETETFAGLAAGTCVLVADIGDTNTSTGWIGSERRLRGRHVTSSRALLGPDAVLGVVIDGLRRASKDANLHGHKPVAIGVGSAGVIDGGIVTSAADSIIDWVGTDVAGELTQTMGLPATVLNNIHAHGLGEATWGAGKAHDSTLLVVVGTRIGGAIITGGQVLQGARAAAGQIGHMSIPEAAGVMCPCGKTGHLEGLASGAGILRSYKLHGEQADTTEEVFAHAADGQNLATNVITDCAFATGRAVGDLLNVLDPDVVVISGGISETGDVWWSPLRRGIAASAITLVADTTVVPATLGTDAILIGAGHHALVRS